MAINRNRLCCGKLETAIKMLRDLLKLALSLAQHVVVANTCTEVRALMHNWSI